MAGISVPSLLLILLLVVLIFGTKKLRNIGSDLGGAIRSFRKATREDDEPEDESPTKVIEGQAREQDDK